MGQPVEFEGFTHDFGPPPGKEEEVGRLKIFSNGQCVVSCWELTDAEIADIVESRKVWTSHWTGTRPVEIAEGQWVEMPIVFPTFVGSESVTASVVADTGKVWR